MRTWLYWTAVTIAVVSVLGGGWYAYARYTATSSPATTTRGYFAALARADAPAALGFGDLPDGPHDLLTSAVLRQQQRIAPLHDVSILDVAEAGDQADVRYSYRLRFPHDDQEITGSLRVVHRDSGWRLARTALTTTVQITQASDRFTFAGSTVPSGPVLMFPGALPLHFDTANLQVDASTAAVQFGGSSTIAVTIEATAAARAELTTSLTTRLHACVTGSASPTNCPVPSARAVPGSLRGHIVGAIAPKLTFSVTSAASGTIDMIGTLAFSGQYRSLSYDNLAALRTGRASLSVEAVAPAAGPLSVRFAGSA